MTLRPVPGSQWLHPMPGIIREKDVPQIAEPQGSAFCFLEKEPVASPNAGVSETKNFPTSPEPQGIEKNDLSKQIVFSVKDECFSCLYQK
ncbi:MAG: hypothetical protein J6A56_00650 [Clostridia bacterium]|nr:hypothetical protein [Clostridia bacterium]